MLFTVRNRLKNKLHDKFEIVSDGKMMGIVNRDDKACILPFEYDNVFVYGEDVLVLHNKGKIGAIRIEEDGAQFIAECEFDTLDSIGHDMIFCNDKKVRYYNSVLKSARDFIDIIVDIPFLYCKDEQYQYILYGESGKELYKKKYTSYSESCFCYCGNTDNGPVFYDARYSTYLYPVNDVYKVYNGIFLQPVIVNRQNVSSDIFDPIFSSFGALFNDSFVNNFSSNFACVISSILVPSFLLYIILIQSIEK